MSSLFRFAAALLLLWPAPGWASTFKDLIPGAKAAGMGQAVTSIADEPFAMFYNPAGTANTPYTQLATTLGRMDSPRGLLTLGSIAYVRPFDRVPTASIGFGYLGNRQINSGDKDQVVFHYSQEFKLPQLLLAKPVKAGANFKMLNAEQGGGVGFGIGFDAGLLFRSNMGLSGGLSIQDMTTNVGLPRPILGIGLSYQWARRFTLAMDARVREGLSEFYPGFEASFHQGLLKFRTGRGMRLDSVETVAFGLGLNFSPMVLDLSMSSPMGGFLRTGGAYQASFNWRFGAAPFTGSFVGSAAADAERLKSDVSRLEDRKKTLQVEAESAQSTQAAARGEMSVIDKRLREMQEEYRSVSKLRDEKAYELELIQLRIPKPPPPPPPKPKPQPAPPPTWPQWHAVQPGETLRAIAQKRYGDAGLWERIFQANRDKVDRGIPREGAVLQIPAPGD